MARLVGENNVRHPEDGTEDGMKDSDEEDLQDGDGNAHYSTAVLMVSHKKERKLKAIHRTEEALIDADEGSKDKYLLKANKLILHQISHADLCNKTECEENEKVQNIHEGCASGNVR